MQEPIRDIRVYLSANATWGATRGIINKVEKGSYVATQTLQRLGIDIGSQRSKQSEPVVNLSWMRQGDSATNSTPSSYFIVTDMSQLRAELVVGADWRNNDPRIDTNLLRISRPIPRKNHTGRSQHRRYESAIDGGIEDQSDDSDADASHPKDARIFKTSTGQVYIVPSSHPLGAPVDENVAMHDATYRSGPSSGKTGASVAHKEAGGSRVNDTRHETTFGSTPIEVVDNLSHRCSTITQGHLSGQSEHQAFAQFMGEMVAHSFAARQRSYDQLPVAFSQPQILPPVADPPDTGIKHPDHATTTPDLLASQLHGLANSSDASSVEEIIRLNSPRKRPRTSARPIVLGGVDQLPPDAHEVKKSLLKRHMSSFDR